MTSQKVFRSREQSVVLVILGALVLLAVPTKVLGTLSNGLSTAQRIGFSLAAVAIGSFLIFRLARCGAYATDAGIRVVNPFRTRFVPWTDIRGFSVRRAGYFPGVGNVDLNDGTSVRIWGIQIPNPLTRPNNASAQRLIASLNRLLAERRRSSSPG